MASKTKYITNPNIDDHDEDGVDTTTRSTVSTDDLLRLIEWQRTQFDAALAELHEQIRPAAVPLVPPDDNPRQTIEPPQLRTAARGYFVERFPRMETEMV